MKKRKRWVSGDQGLLVGQFSTGIRSSDKLRSKIIFFPLRRYATGTCNLRGG